MPGIAVKKRPLPAASRPPFVARHDKIQKAASRISALLLFGLFVDYGGGFGIKNVVVLLALGWVFFRRGGFRIRWADLIVLLVIPGLLGLFHLGVALIDPVFDDTGLMTYGLRFYNTISSFVLILLFSVFHDAGSHTVMRQIVTGLRLVAVIILVIYALHVTGIINLYDYEQVARTYRVGFIGLDPRIPGVEASLRPILSPRIAFVMPLAFAYELYCASTIGALLMFLALLVVGSRGLLIGVGLLFVFWIFISLRKARLRFVVTRIVPLVVVLLSVMLLFQPIRFRLTGVFMKRLTDALQGEDLATQIRVGHLEGYLNLVEDEPWTLLFGAGPVGYFTNPFLGFRYSITEMSILNLALWYGLPYALLFTLWLYRAAWRLWHLRHTPGFNKGDLGLIFGAGVFWLTGNINPQMTGPFAIIAYMLLVARIAELKSNHYFLHAKKTSPTTEMNRSDVAAPTAPTPRGPAT